VDFGWGAFLRPWQEWRERPADTTIFATAYEDAHHMKVLLAPTFLTTAVEGVPEFATA